MFIHTERQVGNDANTSINDKGELCISHVKISLSRRVYVVITQQVLPPKCVPLVKRRHLITTQIQPRLHRITLLDNFISALSALYQNANRNPAIKLQDV